MKLTTIAMALAFVAGTAGLSGAASAQDRGPPPTERGVRHEEVRRTVHVRRDVRHYARHDRRNWGHRRHCRTVWRHHHRIRRCW